MFVSLRMLTLPDHRIAQRDEHIAALRSACDDLPGITSNWIAPMHSQGVINAGHIIWRMCHASQAAAQEATLSPAWAASIVPALAEMQITGAGYCMRRANLCAAGAGIWRGLLFRCFDHCDPAKVRELSEKTLLLPQYVPEIRSWALNPVCWTEGPRAIDFVWEQEYDSIEGLTGPYMHTPIHWGIVDAYFDADCPDYIVDPHLIQMAGEIDRSIMDGSA